MHLCQKRTQSGGHYHTEESRDVFKRRKGRRAAGLGRGMISLVIVMARIAGFVARGRANEASKRRIRDKRACDTRRVLASRLELAGALDEVDGRALPCPLAYRTD